MIINYGSHFIDKNDIKSVVKVLKSKNLTQGRYVENFENNLK
jgi:dTDP-4-amino-4,6-dideoxygalactose transaminase